MGKTTTTRVARGPRARSTFKDLVDGAGGALTVASRARVGYATVYRATKGTVPGQLQLWALSRVLGQSETALRALIEASAA